MRYLFEEYALDADRRELRRGAAVVRVAAQAFDLIEFLLRHRARVVSKDELIDAIWDGRIVSDSAITTRLNAARRALGDNGREQRLIKTLPRRGYRFIAAAREEPPTQASAPADDSTSRQAWPALDAVNRAAIAVLPFTSIPGDHNTDQYCDWIASDLMAELSKQRWLLVVARNVSFAEDEGERGDVCEIGRKLGVRYVLKGAVRRARGLVRATVQLFDATTGVHLWNRHYDQRWANNFADHDEAIQAIAATVATVIAHAEQQRALRTTAAQLSAWESYQIGMWHMSKVSAADNKLASGAFQHAIDLDPTFGRGYATLALTHLAASSIFSAMPIALSCELAEPLVRKAITLDSQDAEFRARMALTTFLKGDTEGAVEESDLILSASAHNADAFGVKGAALVYSGHSQKGRDSIRRYLKLDPHDVARPIRVTQLAASLYLDGGYQEAMLVAKQVVRQYPGLPIGHRWLAASLGQLGRTADAEEALHAMFAKAPATYEMYLRQKPPQYSAGEYKHMLRGLRKAGWKE